MNQQARPRLLSRLKVLARRVRWLPVTLGVVASSATALAIAQPAVATYETYSCSACEAINGPNRIVTNSEAVNYSKINDVCAGLYRYNGGTNYTLLVDNCTTSGSYNVYACYGGGEVTGHGKGETKVNGNNHLAGHEDNYKYCG